MSRPIPSLCFTGHRYPDRHELAERVKGRLLSLIRGSYTHNGTRTFMSGMAMGVDLWAAETVLALKDTGQYPGIRLACAVPFHTQYARWENPHLRDRWERVIQAADEIWIQEANRPGEFWPITAIQLLADLDQIRQVWALEQADRGVPESARTEFPDEPQAGRLLNLRNHFMVDRTDGVLAIWDGSPGGTANCVAYARGKKPLLIWNPVTGAAERIG